MPKIMEVISVETGCKSYNTYKYSYDSIGLPSIDYDDENNKVMKWHEKGETIKQKTSIDLKDYAKSITNKKSIITYFLDGSRRVFKVDDISINKQVFPVIAGQVGVGCCKRVDKKMIPEKNFEHLLISAPDKLDSDGWESDAFFNSIKEKINQSRSINLKLNFLKF